MYRGYECGAGRKIDVRRYVFSLPRSARRRKFVRMKKKLAAQSVFFVLFIFFFVGCASTPRQEIMTEPDPNAQGAGAVPGEKVSDDGGLAPGATGTNPSVRW
jgi:hypothetical protein